MNLAPSPEILEKLSKIKNPDEIIDLPAMFENETRPADGWVLMTFSGKSPFLSGAEICFALASQTFKPNEPQKMASADWTLFLLSSSKGPSAGAGGKGIVVAKDASGFGPTIIPPGVWRLVAKCKGSGSIHSMRFRVISPLELEHALAPTAKSELRPEAALTHVKEVLKQAQELGKTTPCTKEALARGEEQAKQMADFQTKLEALLRQTEGSIRFPAQVWHSPTNGDPVPLNVFLSKKNGDWAVTDWTEPNSFGRSGVFFSDSKVKGVKASDEANIKQAFHLWKAKTKYPPAQVFWRFKMPPVYSGDDAVQILDQKILGAAYPTNGSTSTENSTKFLDILGLVAIGVSMFFPPAIIVTIACTVISAGAKIEEKSEAGFSGFWENRFDYLAIALSGFAAGGKIAAGMAKMSQGAEVLVNTGTRAQAMFSILETGTNTVNVLLMAPETLKNLQKIHADQNLSPVEKACKTMETVGMAILAGMVLFQQFRNLPKNIRTTLENPNAKIKAEDLATHEKSTTEPQAKLAVKRTKKTKAAGGKAKKGKNSKTGKAPGPKAPEKMNIKEAIEGLRTAKPGMEIPFARRIAKLSLHSSKIPRDRIVLGQWVKNRGGYIAEAEINGGNWYETIGSFFDDLKVGIPLTEAESKAWLVNEEVLNLQFEARVGRIDLFGETISEVLLNRPKSFTAKEIKFVRANAAKYGYIEVGNSWVKTGVAP